MLFPLVEATVVYSTIRPLEESVSVHRIIAERSLVDFTTRGDSSPVPINLPFFKEALEDCIVRVHLEADTVGLRVLLVDLASVHRSTLSRLELLPQLSLSVHIIVNVMMCEVIERP